MSDSIFKLQKEHPKVLGKTHSAPQLNATYASVMHMMWKVSNAFFISCLADPVHLTDPGSACRVSVECRDKDHQVLQQRPRLHLSSLETKGTGGMMQHRMHTNTHKLQAGNIKNIQYVIDIPETALCEASTALYLAINKVRGVMRVKWICVRGFGKCKWPPLPHCPSM